METGEVVQEAGVEGAVEASAVDRSLTVIRQFPQLLDSEVLGGVMGGYRVIIAVHYDKLLVRRDPESATIGKDGRLVAPEANREKPLQGTVLAVGNGRITPQGIVPLRVRADDTVIFGRYTGVEIDLGGETLLVLREDEVLASIHNSGEKVEAPTPAAEPEADHLEPWPAPPAE